MKIRRLTLILSCVLVLARSGYGSWQLLTTFNRPVGCSFFLDEKTGFLGFGNQRNRDALTCVIRKTTDGGLTWTQCNTPPGTGIISSIFMQDRNTGYASLMYGNVSALWKTTDGGNNWSDITYGNLNFITCIYATTQALTATMWFAVGGRSINGGMNYSQDFQGVSQARSNGIDFLDDNIGVVTLGPDGIGPNWTSLTYRTIDGGKTWLQGGAMHESWGVYACKATQAFYSLAENNQSAPGNAVYASFDQGASWQQVASLSSLGDPHFTGHIAGAAGAIYAQTDTSSRIGLFRSDDFGKTWKNVGGPSNVRDTRFSVTGCNGEVVYAFDDQGAVWKTTDGGDGTLRATPFSISFDTATLRAHYCIPTPISITFVASNCYPLSIDSVTVSDSNGVISVEHTPSGGTIGTGRIDSVQMIFQSDSDAAYDVHFHVKGTSGGNPVDTVFTLRIDNTFNATNGPMLGLSFDSVRVETHYCEPTTIVFPLSDANNCSPVVVDTIEFDDPSSEFAVTHEPAGGIIPVGGNDSVVLSFLSTNNEHRVVPVHLRCHIAGRVFDTTLYADAFHSRSPEPYLEDPIPTRIGDTVSIALRLMPPTDTINFSHIGFHLAYNGDILTLAPNPTITANTLSEKYKSLKIDTTEAGTLDCAIDLNTPITNSSDLTKPIIRLRFLVSLTKALSCPVLLDSFSIVGNTPLSRCSIPSTMFNVLTQCSDSIISRFMLDGEMPGFASIRPNPANRRLEIVPVLGGRPRAGIQLLDILGHVVAERYVDGPNPPALHIETSGFPSGRYYLRMIASDGSTASAPVEISH